MTEDQLTKLETEVEEALPRLRRRLSIMTTELPKECSEQSELYGEVADLYARCYQAHIQLIQRVKELREGMSLKIRQSPVKYGMADKYREGDITSTIESDGLVQKVKHRRNRADGLRVRMEGLKSAFEHRRSMINNEVDIFCHSGVRVEMSESKDEAFTAAMRGKRQKKSQS